MIISALYDPDEIPDLLSDSNLLTSFLLSLFLVCGSISMSESP